MVVRPVRRPPVHVTVLPFTVACHPAGDCAESTVMPGGAVTVSEIVAWGGRSFGVSNVIVLGTPSSTKGVRS